MGKLAIATALRGFNDLGHSVTPTFLSRNRFYLQYTHCPKMKKNCAWDIEFCHLATAGCMKLWLLNSNLFFKEPQQLTKFSYVIGPLKQSMAKKKIQFKDLIVIFWGLQTLWSYQLTKPAFSDLGYLHVWGHFLSKTKSVTPIFFRLFAADRQPSYSWRHREILVWQFHGSTHRSH